jgi:hypothetical protein
MPLDHNLLVLLGFFPLLSLNCYHLANSSPLVLTCLYPFNTLVSNTYIWISPAYLNTPVYMSMTFLSSEIPSYSTIKSSFFCLFYSLVLVCPYPCNLAYTNDCSRHFSQHVLDHPCFLMIHERSFYFCTSVVTSLFPCNFLRLWTFTSTLLMEPYLSYPWLFPLLCHSASLTLILSFVMLSLISPLPLSSLHLTQLLILYLPFKFSSFPSQSGSYILPIFPLVVSSSLSLASSQLHPLLCFCLVLPLPFPSLDHTLVVTLCLLSKISNLLS